MLPSSDYLIVGAGPVGLVSALLLSRQGYRSRILESRPDPRRNGRPNAGRSISFTLTTRGWKSLRAAGAEAQLRKLALPLRGRVIHLESGVDFHPYGGPNEAIDCVGRTGFVAALLDLAEADANISIAFEHRYLGYQPSSDVFLFDVGGGASQLRIQADRVIAADGVHSTVRRSFADDERVDFSVRHSRHFYREVTIVGDGPAWPFDPRALHVWPREDCLLVGFPNQQREHQFTGTLFMPLDGALSFNAIGSPGQLRAFFAQSFPDLAGLTPHLADDFFGGPPASLISMRCRPWVFADRVVLVGDAAHAMVPFLGQGLNAGLEDALTLTEAVRAMPNDWRRALELYETARKPSCDAVTDLAEEHYRELALDARSPDFLWRKRVEARLMALLPDRFSTVYSIVSFSERPYTDVAHIAAIQRALINEILRLPDLAKRWDTPELDRELLDLALRTLPPSLGTAAG